MCLVTISFVMIFFLTYGLCIFLFPFFFFLFLIQKRIVALTHFHLPFRIKPFLKACRIYSFLAQWSYTCIFTNHFFYDFSTAFLLAEFEGITIIIQQFLKRMNYVVYYYIS